jgi:hypothetical protein
VPPCSGFVPPSSVLCRRAPRGSFANGLHQSKQSPRASELGPRTPQFQEAVPESAHLPLLTVGRAIERASWLRRIELPLDVVGVTEADVFLAEHGVGLDASGIDIRAAQSLDQLLECRPVGDSER